MPFTTEEKRHTPERAQPNEGIDDTCRKRVGSSADPGNKIKFEQTEKAPVNATDDQQDKSDSVKHCFRVQAMQLSF